MQHDSHFNQHSRRSFVHSPALSTLLEKRPCVAGQNSTVVVWRPRHRQIHELDDHLLSDIGMSRTLAEEARGAELYQSAWRDSK